MNLPWLVNGISRHRIDRATRDRAVIHDPAQTLANADSPLSDDDRRAIVRDNRSRCPSHRLRSRVCCSIGPGKAVEIERPPKNRPESCVIKDRERPSRSAAGPAPAPVWRRWPRHFDARVRRLLESIPDRLQIPSKRPISKPIYGRISGARKRPFEARSKCLSQPSVGSENSVLRSRFRIPLAEPIETEPRASVLEIR
jgi:hypothetical protein